MLARLKFLQHHPVFSVPNALPNDVFRGLCNDPAKLHGVKINLNQIANLRVFIIFLRLFQQDLFIFVFDFFYNLLLHIDSEKLFINVNVAVNHIGTAVIPAGGDHNSVADFFSDILRFDAFFRFHQPQRFKKLVVSGVFRNGLACFFCHESNHPFLFLSCFVMLKNPNRPRRPSPQRICQTSAARRRFHSGSYRRCNRPVSLETPFARPAGGSAG